MIDDGDVDKILVFCTTKFFRLMCSSDTLIMDGTFSSVPKLFCQLYSIHTLINKTMITLLYALLPDKSSRTYARLFRLLQDKATDLELVLSPQRFLIDFEYSVITVLKTLFPASKVSGCCFHFNQSLFRRLCSLGFEKLYSSSGTAHETFKRVMALPYLRTEDTDSAFAEIKQQSSDDLEPFFSYFEETYLRPGCRFDRSIWSTCCNFTLRTTNHVEGWHNALNRSVGIHHANFWRFLKKLQEQQKVFDTRNLILESGRDPCRPLRRYEEINQALSSLYHEYCYSNLTVLEFLDRIKHYLC